ncbi:MAG TPA: hypothetical protein PKD37_06580 [Oligoflexia bacterium]|nr:hypothetical protein [Oligoflexia bacterium]HMP27627.1 hypothetical protein [Oligoflexia bacterium]
MTDSDFANLKLEELAKQDKNIKRLFEIHRKLDREINELTRKKFLTRDEEQKAKILKFKKLENKDKLATALKTAVND